jgi:hypothetical protein
MLIESGIKEHIEELNLFMCNTGFCYGKPTVRSMEVEKVEWNGRFDGLL